MVAEDAGSTAGGTAKRERRDDPLPPAWTAGDGTTLAIRPIRPRDVERMRAFVRGLSFGSRYFRFGTGDPQYTDEEILRVCTPDPGECVHLVVVRIVDDTEEIVASGRIVFESAATSCEFAIAVRDEWQGRGLGRRLLNALIAGARLRGHTEVHARVLATNAGMIAFLEKCDFEVGDSIEGPGVKLARRTL